MQRTCLAALLLVTASTCRSGGPPSDPAAGTTVLQGGTLINPGAEPVPNALIVIQEGRITCAGTGAACTYPAGAKSVELSGGYVGPGLIDAHVHYSQTGWVDGRPDAADLRHLYPYDSVIRELQAHPEHFHRASLCSGVTSAFDVGGFRWNFDLAKKTRSATDAPLVVAAGPLLSTVELPSDMMEVLVLMKDDSTVRAAVRDHQRRGAGAIKVWYIELPDSLRKHARAMLAAAADETRKVGLRLLVHATEAERAREAVEAGAAVLVHGVFDKPMDPPLLAAMKQSGVIVIPTISVLDGYADVYRGRSPAYRYPLMCVDSATRRKLTTVLPDSLLKEGRAFWEGPKGKALRSTTRKNLRLMYRAGIPLAMGTDAGNPGTTHGPSIYNEMEEMQRAGMSAADVFASATIVAARAMALDTVIGSVEPGKRADLVVFDADPTADIRNARQVRLVIHNGVVRTRGELLPP
jgi:imidazolonepropionase-like amidohydrolase